VGITLERKSQEVRPRKVTKKFRGMDQEKLDFVETEKGEGGRQVLFTL